MLMRWLYTAIWLFEKAYLFEIYILYDDLIEAKMRRAQVELYIASVYALKLET